MKKIVYLPLDERPCNYDFPQMLLSGKSGYSIVRPSKEIMGDKKNAANHSELEKFLVSECEDAYGVILSIDTLLYGGIVPSRLHSFMPEELSSKLGIINKLKALNKDLVIYAFSLIMRCPQYSSSDEEPDYYEDCGLEIFKLGEGEHKQRLNIITEAEKDSLPVLRQKVAYCIEDYLSRRAKNVQINIEVIDMVGGSIDFLIIPQDDSSVYGYIAVDQQKVRSYVKQVVKQMNVLVYPGADEVGMTLLARMINKSENRTPLVAVNYASVAGMNVIPLYEDRPVGESIKLQICAAGGMIVEDSLAADMVLMVNSPSSNMTSSNMIPFVGREYNTDRSLTEFVHKIRWLVSKGKVVAIADVAYVNGGDTELVSMLNSENLLFKLGAYSGWNTSSNTLGTAIAQSMLQLVFGSDDAHELFLAARYYEDVGYCSYARKYVCENILPQIGLNYFNSSEKSGKVSAKVQEVIEEYLSQLLPSLTKIYKIDKCSMPWTRMFEVDLKIIKK